MAGMKSAANTVLGVNAPPPRPTRAGAFWLACLLSVPVFGVLSVLEWLWRFRG
ncbi:hypothetical protein [Meridianimarinicoccus roseus]|uniref:hypothetical protein n=1 Tax=Meridianimarinicoccus roseus TaxID=2072018 RepID=UPI001EE68AAF|nr:hypothetical protein [Meridianimarinicoccus roseus]